MDEVVIRRHRSGNTQSQETEGISSAESTVDLDQGLDEPREGNRQLQELIDWFIPTSCRTDPEMYRRCKILIRSVPLIWLTCMFFVTVFALQQTLPPTAGLGVSIGAGVLLLNPFVLKLTGSLKLTATLVLTVMLLGLAYQAAIDAGIRDPCLLVALIMPWFAALLLGPRGAIVWGAVVAGMFGCFYVLHLHGLAVPNFSPERSHWWYQLVFGATIANLVGLMGWVYESTRHKYREKIREQAQAADRAMKLLRDKLAESEGIQRAMAAIPSPCLVLDATGGITYANRAAETLVREGWGKERDGCWFLSDMAATLLNQGLDSAHVTGKPVAVDALHPSSGTWFEVHIAPLEGGAGESIVVLLDTSEHKTTIASLEQEKARAEQELRLVRRRLDHLDELIRSDVIEAAGLVTTFALECGLNGIGLEYEKLVRERTSSVLSVLDTMHELNWLESEEAGGNPLCIDITEEAERAVQAALPQTQEKGLHMWVEPATPDLRAFVDRHFLGRLLSILLANAISQTDFGSITVSLDQDDEAVNVRVKDNSGGIPDAPGLPDESTARALSAGSLAPDRDARMGLDLMIADRLATHMEASLHIKSEPGVGTTISVRLPRMPGCSTEGDGAA